jgi:hypothetical protein
VGLTQVLAWKPGPEEVDLAELRALWERRSTIHRVAVAILLPLAFAAVVLLARGAGAAAPSSAPATISAERMVNTIRGAESIALALPLVFVALTAAGYYWAFLPVVALAFRDQPRKVALLFTVEAVSYGILLFDERDGPVYILRSLLVLYLIVGLWWEPLRDRVMGLVTTRRSHARREVGLDLGGSAPVAVGTDGTDEHVARETE